MRKTTMTKLTDTQRSVLTTAANRENGAITPLPAHIKGGAVTKLINALISANLITQAPYTITPAGRAAIEAEAETNKPKIPDALQKLTVRQIAMALSTITGKAVAAESFYHKSNAIDRLAMLMDSQELSILDVLLAAGIQAIASDGTPMSDLGINLVTSPTPPERVELLMRKPRTDSKQTQMIALMSRPEGATADQIAEATGWQKHTIRGAIAGALKKKLGLTITTEQVRMVGPNREGSPGSYTIYRIVS